MVDFEVPRNCLDSFEGIPSLTINHDATVDLDSTNAFEGPEKLLEVWFAPSPRELCSIEPQGLKAVPVDVWTSMLDLVSCKILSIVQSADVDAYLLSESSMFVWPHKLILKTCGTTTLLLGLSRILQIATRYAGFPGFVMPAPGKKGFSSSSSSSDSLVSTSSTSSSVSASSPSPELMVVASPYRVFYSRKNYLFPDRQKGPHRSWKDEVAMLDRYFPDGSAYMIGKMNGEHWYLYVTMPRAMLTPPVSPPRSEKMSTCDIDDEEDEEGEIEMDGMDGNAEFLAGIDMTDPQCERKDETLEILMTDLDEENARQFCLDHASAVAKDRYRYFRQGGGGGGGGGSQGARTGEAKDEQFHQIFSSFRQQSGGGNEEDMLPYELTTEGHALGNVVASSSGLLDIYPVAKYPEARVDAYLFTPCGFSANGVVPAPDKKSGTHYFTVHVTPEPHCSYASFETNVPRGQDGRETNDIIQHVVEIFKPGRFTVTFFEATREKGYGWNAEGGDGRGGMRKMDRIPGYRRTDRIVHDLDGYDLVFRHYERENFVGGGPRLGEGMMQFC